MMNENYLKQVGKRVKTSRNRMDLSRMDLATLAGVSTQTLIAMEDGEISVSMEDVVRICKALNRSADYILMGEMGIPEWESLDRKLQYLPGLNGERMKEIARAFWETCPNSVL